MHQSFAEQWTREGLLSSRPRRRGSGESCHAWNGWRRGSCVVCCPAAPQRPGLEACAALSLGHCSLTPSRAQTIPTLYR